MTREWAGGACTKKKVMVHLPPGKEIKTLRELSFHILFFFSCRSGGGLVFIYELANLFEFLQEKQCGGLVSGVGVNILVQIQQAKSSEKKKGK